MTRADRVLPRGWVLARIEDTGQYINGFAFKPQHWEGLGKPIIRIQNLTDPARDFNRTTFDAPEPVRVEPGEILVSWSATLDAFIWRGEPALLNQHIFRVIPQERLVAQSFLFYLLKEAIWEMTQTEHLHGSTMRHINRGPFMAFSVPIPPRREQERIVEEIEKQITRLDAAGAALKRVQANLKRYRAAVLKAACEGRLVPTEAELARREGRSYEPGSVLLERILAERRSRWEADQLVKSRVSGKLPRDEKWKAKYRMPDSPDEQSDCEVPEGWILVNLGQLSWSVKDGPHYSPRYVEAGIPFITGGQVRPSGVDFASAKRISSEVHSELVKRCKPEPGDILYTKGGTTGIARVNTYSFDFSVWVHVAVLKLVASIEPFYIQHALNSPHCYAQARLFTHGVGNQDLGLTRMVKIAFWLPPVHEQKRIVAKVDRRLSVVDEIESLLADNLRRAERMRQAILNRAFEGKLVPQIPDDEPASVLLDKIRAERAKRSIPIRKKKSCDPRRPDQKVAASTEAPRG